MLASIGAIASQKKPLVITQGNYSVEAITTLGRVFGTVNISVSGNTVTALFTSGFLYAENAGATQESIDVHIRFSEGGTSQLLFTGRTPDDPTIDMTNQSLQCNLNNVNSDELRLLTTVTAYSDGVYFATANDSELIGQAV